MPPITIRQCAVLAGGLATRLGALATDIPKPILPCGDRPFLAWLLREFVRFGVEEFVLLTGHLSDRVNESLDAIARTLPRPVSIVVNQEPVRAGTAGALFHARDKLDRQFLLCNGDSLFDFNHAMLLAAAAADPADVVGRIVLRRLEDASRYGVVETAGDVVRAFRERPEQPGPAPGVINGGVYLFDRRVLDHVAPVCSLERDVLPTLAARGQLRGTQAAGHFIDIGIPDDLARARRELPGWLRRPALFLDRDCLYDFRRFDWMPGGIEAVCRAVALGWHVFIVGSQSAASGDPADGCAPMATLAKQLHAVGGTIDDWREHPVNPAGSVAEHRHPPMLTMLLELVRDWDLDIAHAVMICTNERDVQTASAAGLHGILFPGGSLASFAEAVLSGSRSRSTLPTGN